MFMILKSWFEIMFLIRVNQTHPSWAFKHRFKIPQHFKPKSILNTPKNINPISAIKKYSDLNSVRVWVSEYWSSFFISALSSFNVLCERHNERGSWMRATNCSAEDRGCKASSNNNGSKKEQLSLSLPLCPSNREEFLENLFIHAIYTSICFF